MDNLSDLFISAPVIRLGAGRCKPVPEGRKKDLKSAGRKAVRVTANGERQPDIQVRKK